MSENRVNVPAEPYQSSWITTYDGVRRHRLGHYGACAHNRAPPNDNTVEDNGPCSHPHIVFDDNALIVLWSFVVVA